jgi:hypothetical protein
MAFCRSRLAIFIGFSGITGIRFAKDRSCFPLELIQGLLIYVHMTPLSLGPFLRHLCRS